MNKVFLEAFKESKRLDALLSSEEYLEKLAMMCKIITESLKAGGKLLICGNGGSAADSQHLAAEFVGRFMKERQALAAIALTTDTSIMTAIANDYSYDVIFKRQVEALGNKGDVFLGLSTSGNSPNVLLAAEEAKRKEMKVLSLLGKEGGKIKDISDVAFIIPSSSTPRIQEKHIMVGHLICEEVEVRML